MAGALLTYLNAYGVLPEKGLIFTNNDSAYQTARPGAHINATIVTRDQAPWRGPFAGMGDQGIEVLNGHAIAAVTGASAYRARLVSLSTSRCAL